eukprot:3800670-Rhodomonas_salina.1
MGALDQASECVKRAVVTVRNRAPREKDIGIPTDAVVKDLDEFLTRETYLWYTEHCISYKLSYLLHGVPGAGVPGASAPLQNPLFKLKLYLVVAELKADTLTVCPKAKPRVGSGQKAEAVL